ncbi:TPA: hypothetical protein ACN331_002469 [Vibrio parahaemolyticus]
MSYTELKKLSALEYVDDSLARGLVQRFTRNIVEHTSRSPNIHRDNKANALINDLVQGAVSPKRYDRHFKKLMKELGYRHYLLPMLSPKFRVRPLGVVASLRISEDTHGEEYVVVELLGVAYKKGKYGLVDLGSSFKIHISSSHVLERWLTRQQNGHIYQSIEKFISSICCCWLNILLHHTKPLELLMPHHNAIALANEGMLLGEFVTEEKKTIFKAKTYISPKLVRDFNTENCLNKDVPLGIQLTNINSHS